MSIKNVSSFIQLNLKNFLDYINSLPEDSTSSHIDFLKYQRVILNNKDYTTYNMYLDFNDSDLTELFTLEEQTRSNVNQSILLTANAPYESILDSGNSPFQTSVVHIIMDDMTRIIPKDSLNFFSEPNHKLHIIEVFKFMTQIFKEELISQKEPIVVIPVTIRTMSKI